MSWISAIVAAIVGAVKGWFGSSSEPTATALAASDAQARTELAHQEEANEVVSQVARNRSSADLRVVQSVAPQGVDRDVNDKLAEQFPGLFRD